MPTITTRFKPQTLIEATTTAQTSKSFCALNSDTVGLVVADLSIDENVTVQVWADAAATPKWIDYTIKGVQQQATIDSPIIQFSFNDSLIYRIVKPITINSVGVSISPNISVGVLENGD